MLPDVVIYAAIPHVMDHTVLIIIIIAIIILMYMEICIYMYA